MTMIVIGQTTPLEISLRAQTAKILDADQSDISCTPSKRPQSEAARGPIGFDSSTAGQDKGTRNDQHD